MLNVQCSMFNAQCSMLNFQYPTFCFYLTSSTSWSCMLMVFPFGDGLDGASSVTQPSDASFTHIAYLYNTPLFTVNSGCFQPDFLFLISSSLTFNIIVFAVTSI